jgi:hypothetical protein
MRKVCLLISLVIAASGTIAAPSATVLWGAGYLPPVQQPGVMLSGDDLPPLIVAQAQACFDRTAAEALIGSLDRLSAAELPNLSPSLGRYGLLHTWLRSTCSLDANSI